MRPARSRKTAVETLIGMRRPSALMMKPERPMIGFPVFIVRRKAQSASHMLERKTSEQKRPRASFRGIPVISSAARLNEVIRQFRSTVNTPSEMLSRTASVGEMAGCASRHCPGGTFRDRRVFVLVTSLQ